MNQNQKKELNQALVQLHEAYDIIKVVTTEIETQFEELSEERQEGTEGDLLSAQGEALNNTLSNLSDAQSELDSVLTEPKD